MDVVGAEGLAECVVPEPARGVRMDAGQAQLEAFAGQFGAQVAEGVEDGDAEPVAAHQVEDDRVGGRGGAGDLVADRVLEAVGVAEEQLSVGADDQNTGRGGGAGLVLGVAPGGGARDAAEDRDARP